MQLWRQLLFLVLWLPGMVLANDFADTKTHDDVIVEISLDERSITLLMEGAFTLSDHLQVGSESHAALAPETLTAGMTISYVEDNGEIQIIQILSKVPRSASAH